MSANEDMIASVDLGSNSFRLQIWQNCNGQPKVVDSIKEMVRLASGLDEKKNLSKDAQNRALDCLSRFGERLRGFKSKQVRVVATNTFRVAKNIQDFMRKAEKNLGFPIEVIAGREEARLIYLGVAHTMAFNGRRALIVDIGGGSTEFVIGENIHPDVTESLPLGCVSYSMRFFKDGKVGRASFRNAVNAAKIEIQRIAQGLKTSGWDLVVGTSGTARAIRDVIQGLTPDVEFITRQNMQTISEKIIDAGSCRKAHFSGMKNERMQVFSGGLAVMTAVFEELGLERMVIADAALRDGVFYDFVGRRLDADMRYDTVAAFEKNYSIDKAQADRVEKFALKCFSGLCMQLGKQEWKIWKQYVSWSARLHEIGLSISHMAYHKHSAYILEQADMPGFSRKDQKIISTLVLGHRGDLKKMQDCVNDALLWPTILCLRLAALFCRTRTDISFPEGTTLQLNMNKKKYVFSVRKDWLKENRLTADALEQESRQWEKIDQVFQIKML